eukprot:12417677-Karenia_brevis.AAC.1
MESLQLLALMSETCSLCQRLELHQHQWLTSCILLTFCDMAMVNDALALQSELQLRQPSMDFVLT